MNGMVLLALAAATMLFANGRWSVGLAAWIAPLLLLRFVRTQPLRWAICGGWLVMSVATYVWWQGIFPASGVVYVVASIVFGGVALLPYLADRALSRRLGGFAATLVLPAAFVAMETLASFTSPLGSWGSFAYTQAGFLPLIQLTSVTGLAGVTFLLFWFASVVNGTRWRNAVIYASVLAAVLLFGLWRLRSSEATELVRVAAITPSIPTYASRGDAVNGPIHTVLSAVGRKRNITAPQWAAFRARAEEIDRELLAVSEREARAGAKLVLWSEGGAIVERSQESALLGDTASIARRTGAYVAPSFLTFDARQPRTYENENVLVDPAGRTLWTYQKTHPVPGMESCAPGPGHMPVASTPFGRIATVICYDLDFPRLIRQAGDARVDLLLVPADDWREVAPTHARMARFRAIEQGVTIVRATGSGTSATIDRFGRVRASRDYFSGEHVLSAEVPHRGARTLYSMVGDAFAWIAVAMFALLALAALRKRQEREAQLGGEVLVEPRGGAVERGDHALDLAP